MPVCSSGRRQRIARGPRPSCGRHSGSVARLVPDRRTAPRTDAQAQRRAQAKAEAARRPWRRAPRRVPSIGASNPSVRRHVRASGSRCRLPAGRPRSARRSGGQSRPAGCLQGCAPRARACGQAHSAEALARAARRGVAYRCRASHGVMARRTGSRRRRGGGSRAEPSSKNFPCGGRRRRAQGPLPANASPSRG